MPEQRDTSDGSTVEVNPLITAIAGAVVFIGGAVVTGTAHYISTAKSISSEGIPPSARLSAFPVALKAFAVSTIICTGAAAGAALCWNMVSGDQMMRSTATLSSIEQAIELAKQQRVCVTGLDRFWIAAY